MAHIVQDSDSDSSVHIMTTEEAEEYSRMLAVEAAHRGLD